MTRYELESYQVTRSHNNRANMSISTFNAYSLIWPRKKDNKTSIKVYQFYFSVEKKQMNRKIELLYKTNVPKIKKKGDKESL